MTALTILVDMDDVLENLVIRWVETLNARYNTVVSYNDITTWDIASFFPSLTKEQVFSPLYENDFWHTLSTLPNSVKNLKRLIDEGNKIIIVTASLYETVPAKMEWLFEHYPYLSWNNVIITQNKQQIRGDIMIDDGIHNLEGGFYERILMNTPYNQDYDAEMYGMHRASNWDEVYEIVNMIRSENYN